MAALTCKDCGIEMPRGTRFCPACGMPVKRLPLGLIFFLVLLLAAAGVTAHDLRRPDQSWVLHRIGPLRSFLGMEPPALPVGESDAVLPPATNPVVVSTPELGTVPPIERPATPAVPKPARRKDAAQAVRTMPQDRTPADIRPESGSKDPATPAPKERDIGDVFIDAFSR